MKAKKEKKVEGVIRLSEIILEGCEESYIVLTLLDRPLPATAKANLRKTREMLKEMLELIDRML
jgi:hypothetical protein